MDLQVAFHRIRVRSPDLTCSLCGAPFQDLSPFGTPVYRTARCIYYLIELTGHYCEVSQQLLKVDEIMPNRAIRMSLIVVLVASVAVAVVALAIGRPETLWAPVISIVVAAGLLFSLQAD